MIMLSYKFVELLNANYVFFSCSSGFSKVQTNGFLFGNSEGRAREMHMNTCTEMM